MGKAKIMTNDSNTQPKLIMDQWVIYDHPADYPNGYVVRKWETIPGGMMPVSYTGCATLKDAWNAIPLGCVPDGRHPDDDPVIFERWV